MQYENLTPALLADQIKENIISYLKTTFNIKNKGFAEELETHLRSNQGIFKGPYIDIKLPFRTSDKSIDNLLDIKLKIKPFEHQALAFERLSSKSRSPKNTIVATGTGSGKTESFLFPILDHCARANKTGKAGIKAILLYPMNALAFDQSRRIAEIIFGQPELKDVTAGIFVGEDWSDSDKRITNKVMTSPDRIIDDRKSILDNPPDILLTNYKMLDLLLMKHENQRLWADNPQVQFLVLDEMHTYDGAQGADVSFLIRRLKAKLNIGAGHLCCIGTSATLLSGIEGKDILTRFASRLFGEIFTADSIIGESRLPVDEVFDGLGELDGVIPKDSIDLEFSKNDDLSSYVSRLTKTWFNIKADDTVLIGGKILKHKLTKLLFESLLTAEGRNLPKSETDVLKFLEQNGFELSQRQLHSFLSMVAHAHKEIKIGAKTEKVALFQVRVQLWLREIRRTLATLDYDKPQFKWLDEQFKSMPGKHLPPVFCEECGEVGYLTSIDKHHDFQWEVQKIYQQYAESKSNVRYLFPWREMDQSQQLEFEGEITRERAHVCHECGHYEYYPAAGNVHENCPSCNAKWRDFRVWSCVAQESQRDKRQCPSCDSRNSLRLLASRVTTLASIVNSQIFLSKLNPQYSKKLLVFSDTVQDASHRAGYFNARTFRFNFRTAVQSFLSKQKADYQIAKLSEPFFDYYVTKLGEKKTLATLCPSDLSFTAAYEEYFEGKNSDIVKTVKQRMLWELYLEYSLKSQVGRTLEKTLASASYVDYSEVSKNFNDIYDSMANEYEFIRQVDNKKFNQFLFGIIERALLRGAISFDFFKEYRKKESSWELDKKKFPWISRLPKGSLDGAEVGSLPKFISLSPVNKIFDYAGLPEKGQNWYGYWFKKHFTVNGVKTVKSDINNFYKKVLESCADAKLFDYVTQGTGFKNFGIRPELIKITSDIVSLTCPECASRIVVPKHQEADYVDLGCLITNCKGHYVPNDVQPKNYYQSIYESGDIERIFAHEHTGLLGRKDRENLEIEFKEKDFAKRRADAINLLSCTPTLEMGIDVGDLSATVVGALPPTAANYQQQVGRAGRKSGSALVVAIAQSRPRDLLYFEYPEELIAGHIEPPGCFVDAPDLLKRQIFAYLFDQHYADLVKGFANITLQQLLDEVQQQSNVGILSNLKGLLKEHGLKLVTSFRQQFTTTEVTEETWAEIIREFTINNNHEVPLVSRLQNSLDTFLKQKNELEHLASEIRKKLDPHQRLIDNEQSSSEEQKKEFRELRREKASIEAQKDLLGFRDSFFEFLTRYSYLPNYAFQEDSVELVGVILDEDKDSRGRFGVKHRESFDRPAKIALRELAPNNTFYGGGYKLQIDQIEVGGKVKPLVEEWKLCGCCGILARHGADGFTAKTCPRCGDGQWADISSKKRMLRFQKALATETALSSHVGDDAEDRQKKFYKVRPFFDIAKSSVRNAWAFTDEKFVFGLEFINRMTLREVNFGSDTKSQTDKLDVLGEELPNGFRICESCGKVAQVQFDGTEKIKHQSSCPKAAGARNSLERLLPANQADPIMLYRELQSESIRLLLPVSDFEADVRVASIKAAIMLGFTKKFGGRPIHLEISQQIAIVPGSEKMSKRYLVIFDSVPGGTGFLKELWNKDSFFDLINASLQTMENCSCKDSTELDGCLRCILAGASQYEIINISRKEAVKYLKMILERKGQLKELANGLDDVNVDSFLDSDFEYRFLSMLRNLNDSENKLKLSSRYGVKIKSVEVGKLDSDPIYLTIGRNNSDKEYKYKIVPQKLLNDGGGRTISDFYFERLDDDNAKNIAVYLDGFKYHAGPKSGDRLTADMMKRQALINGEGVTEHIVWSITWQDLETFVKDPSDHLAKYLFDVRLAPDHFLMNNPIVQLFKLLAGERVDSKQLFGEVVKSTAKAGKTTKLLEQFNSLKSVLSVEQEVAKLLSSTKTGDDESIIYQEQSSGQLIWLRENKTQLWSVLITFSSPTDLRDGDKFYENWERLLSTVNLCSLLGFKMVGKIVS